MKAGILFRPGSVWIGAHWSPGNKRLCVNVIPFVTFWFTLAGGITPHDKPVKPVYRMLVDTFPGVSWWMRKNDPNKIPEMVRATKHGLTRH
jgi:hypothetical protein